MAFKLRSQAPLKQVNPIKKKETVTLESRVDKFLGGVQDKAIADADLFKDEDPVDNIRHVSAGRYTQEAIAKRLGGGFVANITGVVGSNALGLAHETQNIFKDDRPWKVKLRETGEDVLNNAVGSVIGALPGMNPKAKTKFIKELSFKNKLPDGYQAEKGDFEKGFIADAYFKKEKKKKPVVNNKVYFPPVGVSVGAIKKKK